MEESGHYYTVYFTSLAVGFAEDVAYQHAVLAQMPDEVGWLDASNVHQAQCRGIDEYDLRGVKRRIPAGWRFNIEFALHSLPGTDPDDNGRERFSKNPAVQFAATRNMLLRENPISLEFGLLLHRLGDTFAHTVMGTEQKGQVPRLYTVSNVDGMSWPEIQPMFMMSPVATVALLELNPQHIGECVRIDSLGHLKNMHDPDYPYLRKPLYYDYLTQLYKLLLTKHDESGSVSYRRQNGFTVSEAEINAIFRNILDDPYGLVNYSMFRRQPAETTIGYFIGKIREASRRHLGIEMKPYEPEKIEKQTLPEFLRDHKELKKLGITPEKIERAIGHIYEGAVYENQSK
ncbi:MAG: DUF6765 family protein [Bacteroidota bacterium]